MKWWHYLIGVVVAIGLLYVFGTIATNNKKTETQEEIKTVKEQIAVIEKESGKTLTNEEVLWYLLDLEYQFSLEQKIDAMIILKCESRFNQYAININKNGSLDLGVWQINERIHKLSRECLFDIYCSTEYAINQLYAKNKNFSAWVCAK